MNVRVGRPDAGLDTHLFSALTLRGVTLRNRIVISPMCTYSARDGVADDFHLAHYGRFGLGGAGLVMIEATAVVPEGRISHGDLGLWSDDQIEPLSRIVRVLKAEGTAVGIQLCHAGRKANRQRPWHGNGPLSDIDRARGDLDWPLTAPSAIALGEDYQVPQAISLDEMAQVRVAFRDASRRALAAGFDVVELHAAHGFLLHAFMSPATNRRGDLYSGSFSNRHRYPLEIARDLRQSWPQDRPVFVRISMHDGVEDGRDFDETLAFARDLKACGVDVVDCSSGGIGGHSASTSTRDAPSGYGFQVPYVERVRREGGVAVMAVGLITEPALADAIVREGRADLVAIGRQALVDPNWPLHAQAALGQTNAAAPFASWPIQYGWWLNGRQKVIDRFSAPASEAP